MADQSSPLGPWHPELAVALERVKTDVALVGERVTGRQGLEAQRWSDHEAVHAKDGEALDKALVRTETAIDAASTAHRREHEIEKSAKEAADTAHQQQHVALNELRNVVGDLTGNYVRTDSLKQTVDGWDRRHAELVNQFQEYRDSREKADQQGRQTLAVEEAAYRSQQANEIRSLRESRSEGQGSHTGRDAVWSQIVTAVLLAGAFSGGAVALIIKLSGK